MKVIVTLLVLLMAADVRSYYVRLSRNALNINNVTVTCSHGYHDEVNTTYWQAQMDDLSDRKILGVGSKYQYIVGPSNESIVSCGTEGQLAEGEEVLAYPQLVPGTRDLHTAAVGSTLTLRSGMRTGVRSHNRTTVKWEKNGSPLLPRESTHHKDISTTIENLKLEDGGLYTAIMQLGNIYVEQTFAVIVHSVPALSDEYHSRRHSTTIAVDIKDKNSTNFVFQTELQTGTGVVKSISAPTCRHNGREVFTGEKYRMHSTVIRSSCHSSISASCPTLITSTITITGLDADDSGIFSCDATLIARGGMDKNKEHVIKLQANRTINILARGAVLDVHPLLSGGLRFCLSQISKSLPINRVQLELRFTDREAHTHIVRQADSLDVTAPTTVCHTAARDVVHQLVTPNNTRIQAALKLDGVTGPFVPSLENAVIIPPDPKDPETIRIPEEVDPTDCPVVIAVCTAVVGSSLCVVAVLLVTVACYRRLRQRSKSLHVAECGEVPGEQITAI